MPYVSRRQEAKKEIQEHLGPLAEQMAAHTSEAIVETMESSDPSGEEYPRPSGGIYEASAPGEPPAIRTGQYAEAFDHTEWHMSGGRAVAAVTNDRKAGSGAFLWPFLEYGSVKMAARPHVRPTAERVARVFAQAAKQSKSSAPTIGGAREQRALPPAA